jgi:uncharacterized membrane protein
MFLDIPVVRQVTGFLFYAFIPGYLLIKLLNIERENITETVLFSLGLSLAFLILSGIFVNSLASIELISQPLSENPLSLIINAILSIILILNFFIHKNQKNNINKNLRYSFSQFLYVLLPILSLIGILFSTYAGNNVLLIISFLAIPVILFIVVFSTKFDSHYSIIILSIALVLLLGTTLASMYMYGFDINLEFNIFKATQLAGYQDWFSANYFEQFAYGSMASITILPTLFSNLLNLDPSLVFKILYPVLIAFLPLTLFQLYQVQWGKKFSFISTVFFIINFTYFDVLTAHAKQMIGEIFYALTFLILLKIDKKDNRNSWILLVFFVFALAVSHYSMNYLFLFLVFSTWFFGRIFFRKSRFKIQAASIAFAICISFIWYLYVNTGPFTKLTVTLRSSIVGFLTELFSTTSRGGVIQEALGLTASPTPIHELGRYIHNLTTILIIIGFLYLLAKRKKEKIDPEYFTISALNVGLLLAAVILPRFANFLEVARLYHIVLMFLAPLFVLGAYSLSMTILTFGKPEKKTKQKDIICLFLTSIIIVAFFLFQSGIIYEITNDPEPSSIALSKRKLEDSYALIHEKDAFSANWISDYGDINNIITYADTVSLYQVLTSYSTVPRLMTSILFNSTWINLFQGLPFDFSTGITTDITYVYLRQQNLKNGYITYNMGTNQTFLLAELPVFNTTDFVNNKIYSNGASEIYFRRP